MGKLLAVAFGGAFGSLCRYIISLLADKISGINFPLGTLFVNILGSLLIGFFWNYFDKAHISNEFRLFIFTGFLGGFTTFSTFTRETAQFIKVDEPLHAASYLLASNVIGLAAVFLGFFISHRIFR
jgi:CrcB protein